MTPRVVRRQFRAHQASPARTELRSFPGRTHWLIGQEGWEEVAAACHDWIGSLVAEPAAREIGLATLQEAGSHANS
jgi:hypothetical protein